jgi:hypothetical protein
LFEDYGVKAGSFDQLKSRRKAGRPSSDYEYYSFAAQDFLLEVLLSSYRSAVPTGWLAGRRDAT